MLASSERNIMLSEVSHAIAPRPLVIFDLLLFYAGAKKGRNYIASSTVLWHVPA